MHSNTDDFLEKFQMGRSGPLIIQKMQSFFYIVSVLESRVFPKLQILCFTLGHPIGLHRTPLFWVNLI